MITQRKSLGTHGGALSTQKIKAAYVCIPKDQDRESYIRHCYSTNTVFLRDEFGSTYRNCAISKSIIQEIRFPNNSNEIGDCVIINFIPKHNQAVVVGILPLKNNPPDILSDGEFRMKKVRESSLVDFFGSAERSQVSLSITSSGDQSSRLMTNLTGERHDALLEEYVKGEVSRQSTRRYLIKSNQELDIQVVDDQDNLLGRINYVNGQGLKILDEFSNEILMKDGVVRIKRGENYINMNNKISIGDENSQYKAVLGEILKDKLDRIIDEIVKITVPTALGPSGVPINSVQLLQLKTEFGQFLSDLIKIK